MKVPEGLTRGLPIDDYLACAAFAYFGYRTLSEALAMGDGEKGAGIKMMVVVVVVLR
jgi:hypothetical protein